MPPGPRGRRLLVAARRVRAPHRRERRRCPPFGLHGRPAPLAPLDVLLRDLPLALDGAPAPVALGVAWREARLTVDIVAEVAWLPAALLGFVGRARVRAPVRGLRADLALISGRLRLVPALLTALSRSLLLAARSVLLAGRRGGRISWWVPLGSLRTALRAPSS